MKQYTDDELIKLWEDFGDIPINDDDEILVPFLFFDAGTNRFDIWDWFDEKYSKGVASLLMIKDLLWRN